jgi:hypothetical protein
LAKPGVECGCRRCVSSVRSEGLPYPGTKSEGNFRRWATVLLGFCGFPGARTGCPDPSRIEDLGWTALLCFVGLKSDCIICISTLVPKVHNFICFFHHQRCDALYLGIPIVRPVHPRSCPGPDNNFRGSKILGLDGTGYSMLSLQDCGNLQSMNWLLHLLRLNICSRIWLIYLCWVEFLCPGIFIPKLDICSVRYATLSRKNRTNRLD